MHCETSSAYCYGINDEYLTFEVANLTLLLFPPRPSPTFFLTPISLPEHVQQATCQSQS